MRLETPAESKGFVDAHSENFGKVQKKYVNGKVRDDFVRSVCLDDQTCLDAIGTSNPARTPGPAPMAKIGEIYCNENPANITK